MLRLASRLHPPSAGADSAIPTPALEGGNEIERFASLSETAVCPTTETFKRWPRPALLAGMLTYNALRVILSGQRYAAIFA